jgi:hypothetical protein
MPESEDAQGRCGFGDREEHIERYIHSNAEEFAADLGIVLRKYKGVERNDLKRIV